MKIFYTGLMLLLVCSGLFIKCSKVPPPEVLKTRLLIKLRDLEGKSVTGTIVRLYKNSADSGITKVADSTGVLYYPDLEVATYYWIARNGCKNNLASQTTLNRPLIEGHILYGNSVLSATSAFKIINKSPDSLKISDSTFSLKLRGDTTYWVYHKIGSYKLHYETVKAPLITKDTMVAIKCNDTTVLNLPL